MGWNFRLVYVPGKKLGGTDALSCYGVRHEDCDDVSLRKHLIGLLAVDDPDQNDSLEEEVNTIGTAAGKITWDDVKHATAKDETCRIIQNWLLSNEDTDGAVDDEIKPFKRYRPHLMVEDGVILYKDRIFIPTPLRETILQTLHSAHQGHTSMLLRAERNLFWPGMSRDISSTREKCRTCDTHAPSQPNMPPIQPEVPTYPFQHICSDYFNLYGREFCVVVDRFSGWYNVYHAAGGSMNIIGIFTKLFQDMGVPESLTTDGGTTYLSQSFQTLLKNYGVHHRVSSVGYPHGNTRSEIAVKSAKRLLRSNMNERGDLDTIAITKALLEYRNTPDRDIGLSPAELLYGRNLKDFLPSKPGKRDRPRHDLLKKEWQQVADWRENALSRRGVRIMDKLGEHSKQLPPLPLGCSVLIQNQLGNHPKRWGK